MLSSTSAAADNKAFVRAGRSMNILPIANTFSLALFLQASNILND